MRELTVLRVFVGEDGRAGNPLGVFLDGPAVPAGRRQAIAAELGYSETVFVDDARGAVGIYTPAQQLPFAGHPLVGVSWLLAREGRAVDELRPPAGAVATWDAEGATWIRGDPAWSPEMDLLEYPTPAGIDALDGAPQDSGFAYCWAWVDERAGIVRARAFAPSVGVPEDEATGAAVVRLVAALDRPITVRQGVGSVIHARPGPAGTAEVGGAVTLVERRAHP